MEALLEVVEQPGAGRAAHYLNESDYFAKLDLMHISSISNNEQFNSNWGFFFSRKVTSLFAHNVRDEC